MASAPSPATTPAAAAVYVAAVPLRGPKGPAQALMSAGYSLGLWDLQHFMVLLRPDPARAQVSPPNPFFSSSSPRFLEIFHLLHHGGGCLQALVFDFQPRDPEDALAAFAVLSRREIPGKLVGAHIHGENHSTTC